MRLSLLLAGLFLSAAIPLCNAHNLENIQFDDISRSIIRNNMYDVAHKLFELHMYEMRHFVEAQKPTLKGLWYKLYNKWFNTYSYLDGPYPLLSSYVYDQPEKHTEELQKLIRDNEELWTEADEQCAYEIAWLAISHPQWNNEKLYREDIFNEILIEKDLHPENFNFRLIFECDIYYADFFESFVDQNDRRAYTICFLVAMLLFEDLIPGGILTVEGDDFCHGVIIDNPFKSKY